MEFLQKVTRIYNKNHKFDVTDKLVNTFLSPSTFYAGNSAHFSSHIVQMVIKNNLLTLKNLKTTVYLLMRKVKTNMRNIFLTI